MVTLKLLHMYSNMLDLYGDNGNVEILKYRCRLRGIELEVAQHFIGDKDTDFENQDIIYFGGGADVEQQLLVNDLPSYRENIKSAYKNGVFLFMICGGYQLMGQYYKDSNDKKIEGLGLFDYYTIASTNKRCRCIGNVILESNLNGENYRVIGFENHGGQTKGVKTPFGKVLYGNGNEFKSEADGYMEKNVIATYLHGPLLSKNPKVADYIISYTMSRKTGSVFVPQPVNDKFEEECRKQLFERIL